VTEIDDERIEGGGSPPESKSSERHMQVWNRFFTNAIKVKSDSSIHSTKKEKRDRVKDDEGSNAARTIWPNVPSEEDLLGMISTVELKKKNREDELRHVDGTGDAKDAEVIFELGRVLLAAVLRLDLKSMERLLLLGADPSCQTADVLGLRTPSHFIARYGYRSENSDDDNKRDAGRVARCLGLLSVYGADLEATDAAGRTPLHVAAAYGCYSALEFLLESAVEAESLDYRGHSALHLAYQCGHTDCHTLLLSFNSSNDLPINLNGPASISSSTSTRKKGKKSVKNVENNNSTTEKRLDIQKSNIYDSDNEKNHHKVDKRRDKIRKEDDEYEGVDRVRRQTATDKTTGVLPSSLKQTESSSSSRRRREGKSPKQRSGSIISWEKVDPPTPKEFSRRSGRGSSDKDRSTRSGGGWGEKNRGEKRLESGAEKLTTSTKFNGSIGLKIPYLLLLSLLQV
jgi:hypothetical protein